MCLSEFRVAHLDLAKGEKRNVWTRKIPKTDSILLRTWILDSLLKHHTAHSTQHTRKMAAAIISILSKKFGFNADEALAYYNEHKDETGSATSISTVQRAENAIAKTRAEIDELKAKIPEKKGKMLEKANEKLAKLEEKLAEQLKKLEEKKAKAAPKPETPKKTKAKSKKEEAAPAAPPPAPKKPKAEDDRRIKRMSPTMSKQLAKVFEDAKTEFKKESGPAFAKYVNDLTKDDFEAKGLGDHMRDFVAAIKVPDVPETPADFNAKEPEAIDEDMTEVTFNGVKYVVGDITRRVYEADEENGDRFVGFLGMGKFKDMKIPA